MAMILIQYVLNENIKHLPPQLLLFLNGVLVKLNICCWCGSALKTQSGILTHIWAPGGNLRDRHLLVTVTPRVGLCGVMWCMWCMVMWCMVTCCSYPLAGAGRLSAFSDPSHGSRKVLRGSTSSSTRGKEIWRKLASRSFSNRLTSDTCGEKNEDPTRTDEELMYCDILMYTWQINLRRFRFHLIRVLCRASGQSGMTTFLKVKNATYCLGQMSCGTQAQSCSLSCCRQTSKARRFKL